MSEHRLEWKECLDGDDNSYFEAPSSLSFEGRRLFWRVDQQLIGNKIVWFLDDSEEYLGDLGEDNPHDSEESAKAACQAHEDQFAVDNLTEVPTQRRIVGEPGPLVWESKATGFGVTVYRADSRVEIVGLGCSHGYLLVPLMKNKKVVWLLAGEDEEFGAVDEAVSFCQAKEDALVASVKAEEANTNE